MTIDTEFVHGADRLRQRIRTIRNNLALPVLTESITKLLLDRTLRRFDREVDPDERPWESLLPSTFKRKGKGGKILVRTGNLRGAIKRIRGRSGSIGILTGAESRIGVEDRGIAKYARVHQLGLGIRPRRFLGVGRLDVKAVDSLLRRKAQQLEAL